eukprot:COSAG02_NODE_396_length_23126_cov_282.150258_3_plen_257_part_00
MTGSHRHDPPAVSASHALQQLSSITALLRVGASAPFKSKATERAIDDIHTPGELVEVELPAVPTSILEEYARWTTGIVSEVAEVPPHLFPQWTFPPMIRALSGLPFPMTSVLNQGCRLEVHGPLPAGEPMECTAQLVGVEREPTKIKITTKITTGTRKAGAACTALVYAVVPQRRGRTGSGAGGDSGGGSNAKEKREPATVPAGAECVGVHALGGSSGRHYAFLSGDFNPIHWITPAAKAAGFRSCILHGCARSAQ